MHSSAANRLYRMSVCKLPLFPASQVANLPACPSPMVSGDQTAAVFDVPCINDEKPSAADGALPGSIAHTKHLEPVGTVSPSRKTDERPRKGKNI